MTTKHRVSNLLTIVFAGCGLVACTTQEVKSDGGGSGGRAGGTGGTAGTGTGGSAGGAGGGYATNDGIACRPPAQMITDFTYDADGGPTDQVRFGTFGTTLSGGQSAYGGLTGNVTGNDWHLMGNIADYSGFNLYFDTGVELNDCNKFDASAFKGITFTIWGTTGGNMITLGVSTLQNSVAYGWLNQNDAGAAMPKPGRCQPTQPTGNPFYHPGCDDPTYKFAVTGTQASPQTVTALWSDFSGGMPIAGVTPTDILSVYWNVAWMPPTTPYAVDIHIDNLAFIP
jgi:hypothetical protein